MEQSGERQPWFNFPRCDGATRNRRSHCSINGNSNGWIYTPTHSDWSNNRYTTDSFKFDIQVNGLDISKTILINDKTQANINVIDFLSSQLLVFGPIIFLLYLPIHLHSSTAQKVDVDISIVVGVCPM